MTMGFLVAASIVQLFWMYVTWRANGWLASVSLFCYGVFSSFVTIKMLAGVQTP